MVYFVDDARADGVETSLMMDFVRIALLRMEIHSLMIQTRILSIILQIFLTHLHNPSLRLTYEILLLDILRQKSIHTRLTDREPITLYIWDEHLDTIPATESDEVIKSSVENLVPIPREFEVDPILEEFADELAHIAPIPPGIVEADPDDDTSSDDDDFEECRIMLA
ncbi:hypothetical protein Tco_1524813 [Tanacetum coccineum]